jgi:hypothetical protein
VKELIPAEVIENKILLIRSEKVMLDADLPALYGVTTKRLNEQVKRNRERFPEDFMFQLSEKERAEVVANCDHLRRLKFSPNLPYAFTEHGAIMLATVLNSPVAVQASIQVVRAFVKLRQMLSTFAGKNKRWYRYVLVKNDDAAFRQSEGNTTRFRAYGSLPRIKTCPHICSHQRGFPSP